ncbi:MAG: 30S ribosomal protein S12 methylthiotransferase RimO [Hyphomicrobiales bacterium]|nr:30S ribosomal protein S12 methylthiotransferase RimO [Hyphomicrobiales bacterium]
MRVLAPALRPWQSTRVTEAPIAEPRPAPRISFVSLGCPKALVDSERVLTRLRAEGYELSQTHAGADAVIVNTCGFLDSAKAESLAAIGQAMNENGRVIVTGCIGADPGAIREAFPNVLAVTGPQAFESVMTGVREAAPAPHDPFVDLIPGEGVRLTPRHYAYLKIAEGCDHRCTFCIIPTMRGRLASRPASDVMREAERLVRAGVKELIVIAQDTSAYGRDLKYTKSPWRDRLIAARFLDIVRELGSLGAWVRLQYVYPYPHVDEAIALMNGGGVLPYIDVPFQHASPSVLKAMRRPGNQQKTLERIRAWRDICPELTIRSTFIVGFPGETEEDFRFLLDWLEEARLDRVGAFKYEPVKGAKANDLGLAPVPDEVKESRHKRFMLSAQAISAKKLAAKVGKRLEAIVDAGGAQAAKGRTKGDAPEIDGIVHIATRRPLRAGDIATVKVERADAYDLWGTAV